MDGIDSSTSKRTPSRFLNYLGGALVGLVVTIVFKVIAGKSDDTVYKLIERFIGVFVCRELWVGLAATVGRFLLGYITALVLGTAIGLAKGRSRWVERVLDPPVSVLRPIPSAAMIPLALLLFSYTGLLMKVFIIAYGVIWPILLQVAQGSKNIDETLIDTGRTLGKSRLQIFFCIVLPGTMSDVMTGARVGLGIGLLLAVTTEIIVTGEPSGIGFLILDYERSFKFPEMLAAVVMLGLIGWFMDYVLRRFGAWLLPWHPGHCTTEEKSGGR